jgi:hypothetical protein
MGACAIPKENYPSAIRWAVRPLSGGSSALRNGRDGRKAGMNGGIGLGALRVDPEAHGAFATFSERARRRDSHNVVYGTIWVLSVKLAETEQCRFLVLDLSHPRDGDGIRMR